MRNLYCKECGEILIHCPDNIIIGKDYYYCPECESIHVFLLKTLNQLTERKRMELTHLGKIMTARNKVTNNDLIKLGYLK